MPKFVVTKITQTESTDLHSCAVERGMSVEEYARNLITEAVNERTGPPYGVNDPPAAGRARGVRRLSEMLSRKDMRTAEEMAESMGISTEDVDGLHRAYNILRVDGLDGETKYPQWQLNPDGTLIDCLEEALAILGNKGPTAYRILCEIFPNGSDTTNYQCRRDGEKKHVLRRLQAIARGDYV